LITFEDLTDAIEISTADPTWGKQVLSARGFQRAERRPAHSARASKKRPRGFKWLEPTGTPTCTPLSRLRSGVVIYGLGQRSPNAATLLKTVNYHTAGIYRAV
jgi:hypothetical protein